MADRYEDEDEDAAAAVMGYDNVTDSESGVDEGGAEAEERDLGVDEAAEEPRRPLATESPLSHPGSDTDDSDAQLDSDDDSSGHDRHSLRGQEAQTGEESTIGTDDHRDNTQQSSRPKPAGRPRQPRVASVASRFRSTQPPAAVQDKLETLQTLRKLREEQRGVERQLANLLFRRHRLALGEAAAVALEALLTTMADERGAELQGLKDALHRLQAGVEQFRALLSHVSPSPQYIDRVKSAMTRVGFSGLRS